MPTNRVPLVCTPEELYRAMADVAKAVNGPPIFGGPALIPESVLALFRPAEEPGIITATADHARPLEPIPWDDDYPRETPAPVAPPPAEERGTVQVTITPDHTDLIPCRSCGATASPETINALQSALAALRSELSAAYADLSASQREVAALRAENQRLRQEVSDLETDVIVWVNRYGHARNQQAQASAPAGGTAG